MFLFWALAAILVASTLAVLLWPLLRARTGAEAPNADDATVAVYRDQKRALDAEYAAGGISPSERDATLAELAQRIAEDVPDSPRLPEGADGGALRTRARVLAACLLVLIPVGSFAL
jgi:cytochrome c-type biogenesis protein CcmI